MRPVLRLVRCLAVATAASIFALAAAACKGGLATVLDADASDSPSGEVGGAACTTDAECNDDAISALRGKCTKGACECNPGVSATANGKCGAPIGDGGATIDDCVAKGGVCIGKSTPPPNHRPARMGEGTCAAGASCWVPETISPGSVCLNDRQCNGDPAAAALWGSCFYGVCMCSAGYTVQPNGKCNVPPPPTCAIQNGTCRQGPAQCLAEELGSAHETDMSCGDLVAAACCTKTASCHGPLREAAGSGYVPVEFVCCAPNDAAHAPICVNGWQTCPKGDTAVAKPGRCG